MRRAAGPLAAGLLIGLTACAGSGTPPPAHASAGGFAAGDWRRYATDQDRSRLRGWRDAFTRGLAEARAAGHSRDLAAEGALMDPDARQADAAIPPGDYRCRVTKLGGQGGGNLDYVPYPYFRCRIGPGEHAQPFTKLTGSQRQVGALYPDRPERRVFLGTLELGEERRALRYGVDGERDVAGILERVGEARWRLLFPYPAFESIADVMEIVPE